MIRELLHLLLVEGSEDPPAFTPLPLSTLAYCMDCGGVRLMKVTGACETCGSGSTLKAGSYGARLNRQSIEKARGARFYRRRAVA